MALPRVDVIELGEPGESTSPGHPEHLGFRLLAITPPNGAVDEAVVEAWRPGGTVGVAVLLREPGTDPAALVRDDHRLAPLRRACARTGFRCLLSVDPKGSSALEPALWAPLRAPGIGGIQLRGDPSVDDLARARRILPPGHVLGRSCHGQPAGAGAWVDYSVLAPIFTPRTPSPTPGPGKRAVGLAPLRTLAQVERRVFALGGITADNAVSCVRAGAFGLAAIRTFFGPPLRVADNVARLVDALTEPTDDAAPPP
ncbi:MAG: thiamine phosphate synthase [Myxococcota bacterium]